MLTIRFNFRGSLKQWYTTKEHRLYGSFIFTVMTDFIYKYLKNKTVRVLKVKGGSLNLSDFIDVDKVYELKDTATEIIIKASLNIEINTGLYIIGPPVFFLLTY